MKSLIWFARAIALTCAGIALIGINGFIVYLFLGPNMIILAVLLAGLFALAMVVAGAAELFKWLRGPEQTGDERIQALVEQMERNP
jgi:hypothetical protein